MANNQHLSYPTTPCKWGKRPYRQSPIRIVVSKAKLLNIFRYGF